MKRIGLKLTLCAAAISPLLAATMQTAPSPADDAKRGQTIFERRCTGCHALDAEREGPHLRGVFGRNAGSVHGFGYSAALRNAHIVWSEATLDHWLADPETFVPGSAMDMRVPRADERRELIRYLQQLASPPHL